MPLQPAQPCRFDNQVDLGLFELDHRLCSDDSSHTIGIRSFLHLKRRLQDQRFHRKDTEFGLDSCLAISQVLANIRFHLDTNFQNPIQPKR